MITVFIAFLALAVAFGGWIGIRYSDFMAGHDADLSRYLVSIPTSAWKDDDDE
jgi:hypothetical protein